MTITRADVADLEPGDVVEITDERWPDGSVLRGPAYFYEGELRVGHLPLATHSGRLYIARPKMSLTVVSRAPRPLYVNSDKTEPTRGDVARDDSNDLKDRVWVYEGRWWHWIEYPAGSAGLLANVRLRLLVDGRTGTTVPQ